MPVWMGGIFLKDEGGYEIVLKSLVHYKKRLQTMHESPELKEAAAMFAPVLQSQAQKRIPMIDETKQKIDQMLQNSIPAQSLEQDLEILEKALECRQGRHRKGTKYRKRVLYETIRRFTRSIKRFGSN